MWDEKNIIDDLEDDFANKKQFMNFIKSSYQTIKTKQKSYQGFETNHHKESKISYEVTHKDSLGLGSCPVASPNTRCCNLLTLDAVQSCGFDCSYCSIQSFYNQNKIVFDGNFRDKLLKLELDPNQIYHIGTGQSSDSLMWGNREGILDALCEFATNNPNVILELKTKSDNIQYLLQNTIPRNIIVTWSLNTQTIIDNEEHYTASLSRRLEAAQKVSSKGILVGFHFHPIVVYENYLQEYKSIYQYLIDNFDPKDVVMVSLGTLTFIKPVIQQLRDRNFKTKILQMPTEDINGKQSYPIEQKREMFKFAYDSLKSWHDKVYFYLCMEPHSLWKDVFGYEYCSNNQFEDFMKDFYYQKISNK